MPSGIMKVGGKANVAEESVGMQVLPSGLQGLPGNFLNNVPPGIRGARRLGNVLNDINMHDGKRLNVLVRRIRKRGIMRLRRVLAGSGVPVSPFLQSLHPDGPSGIIHYPFPGAPTEMDDI